MTSNEILEQGLLNVKFEVTMVIAQHIWLWRNRDSQLEWKPFGIQFRAPERFFFIPDNLCT